MRGPGSKWDVFILKDCVASAVGKPMVLMEGRYVTPQAKLFWTATLVFLRRPTRRSAGGEACQDVRAALSSSQHSFLIDVQLWPGNLAYLHPPAWLHIRHTSGTLLMQEAVLRLTVVRGNLAAREKKLFAYMILSVSRRQDRMGVDNGRHYGITTQGAAPRMEKACRRWISTKRVMSRMRKHLSEMPVPRDSAGYRSMAWG